MDELETTAVLQERMKHLATKSELYEMKVELIRWIILSNVAVGGALLSVMLYLNAQLVGKIAFFQHLKP